MSLFDPIIDLVFLSLLSRADDVMSDKWVAQAWATFRLLPTSGIHSENDLREAILDYVKRLRAKGYIRKNSYELTAKGWKRIKGRRDVDASPGQVAAVVWTREKLG